MLLSLSPTSCVALKIKETSWTNKSQMRPREMEKRNNIHDCELNKERESFSPLFLSLNFVYVHPSETRMRESCSLSLPLLEFLHIPSAWGTRVLSLVLYIASHPIEWLETAHWHRLSISFSCSSISLCCSLRVFVMN